jgi:thioredoxin reductase
MGRNYADIKLQYQLDANGKYVLDVNDGQDANPDEVNEMNFEVWLSQNTPCSNKAAQEYFISVGYGGPTKFFKLMQQLRDAGRVVTNDAGTKRATHTYAPGMTQ